MALEKPTSTRELDALLEQARRDPEVLAVILFGSAARGEATAQSDLDVCLVLYAGGDQHRDSGQLAHKRLEYLHFDLDVKIFQQLPLYVRRRLLKEGRVLLVKDEDQLYELAFRTAQAFEDFKRIYYDYLEEVARG
jgi:predicted nucleotidyltransferase